MTRRQDRFGYGATIPATTARVVDTAVEILGSPAPGELAFLHTVLASTFLPYRDPKTREYVRQNGRASLILTAGYLLDPRTRQPARQGLAVYPDAKVEQVDGGLLLKPSRPPIRRKVHAVTKG